MLALLALALNAVPVPPPFVRTYSFWLGEERVGAIDVRWDARAFTYRSTHVVRLEGRLEARTETATTDAAGVGQTHSGLHLGGPMPSTLALFSLANSLEKGHSGCLEAEDEQTGKPGRVCATRDGQALDGALLGVHFRAHLDVDAVPDFIELPEQRVRFVVAPDGLPLPQPRDLFGRLLEPGALARLAVARRAHVVGDAAACPVDLVVESPDVADELFVPPALDPLVWRARALQATQGQRSRWAAAQRLGKYVDESLPGGPPTLAEHDADAAWAQPASSCVGHASAFAALARALGWPVRTVFGALLEDGKLAAHAWSEVQVGGRFAGLDPSRGGAPVDARYLPLASSDDADPLLAGRCLLALPEQHWRVLEMDGPAAAR